MRYIIFAILIIFVIIAGYASCGYMADEGEAFRALENLGFSEIVVKDRVVFFLRLRGCSTDDAARFTVTGKNIQGKTIRVFVCVGWPFKSVTIRSK